MKIKYLQQSTRIGMEIAPHELEDGEEARILSWGQHPYRFNIRRIGDLIQHNQTGTWTYGWDIKHVATFHVFGVHLVEIV